MCIRDRDYTIKGWVMDDERLKNGGSVLTTEYFDRLLEQIREIRISERRFYQKITDIYATALDYDRTATVSYTHLDVYKRQTPSSGSDSKYWEKCE